MKIYCTRLCTTIYTVVPMQTDSIYFAEYVA